MHGLWFGNLTLFLVLPLALAWRYRDRAPVAGIALGVAVAAKLFVWPLVVWLLLTRRFAAAAWAVGSAVVLVLGAWALVGFQGFRDYPKLLRAVQDVYAVRSISVSTVAGALGCLGVRRGRRRRGRRARCFGIAAWLVRRDDGDRRAFAVLVAACVLASPIVWPNYAALLFVPIAITWPRLAPAWFFGYATFLLGAIVPNGIVEGVGAAPPGVSEQAWRRATPTRASGCAGSNLIVAGVGLATAIARRNDWGFSSTSSPADGARITFTGLARAARIVRPVLVFVLLPLLVALLRVDSLHDRFATAGYDFRGTLLEPAGQILNGTSPYPSATDVASLASGNPSVYPPLPIVLATPRPSSSLSGSSACGTGVAIRSRRHSRGWARTTTHVERLSRGACDLQRHAIASGSRSRIVMFPKNTPSTTGGEQKRRRCSLRSRSICARGRTPISACSRR